MANVTLNTRIVLCGKDSTTWASNSTVALKGEAMLEWTSTNYTDPPKIKFGDGIHTFAELPYATLTESEIRSIINQAAYNLSPATASVLGGVMIGTNIDIDGTGKISVKDGTTSQKGVVQMSDAINSDSSVTAATSKAVKSAYDRGSLGVTNAATAQQAADQAQATADSKIGSVTLESGTNNGTVKLTVDGSATDNIAVTGLGSAAYTNANTYATAAQGTKADNAMPKSGGTFTGAVTLNADPTGNLGAATKQYVDNSINSKIAASDAMVFKGVISASGTITTLPTTGVVVGDTYKVGDASMTLAGYTCKMGDMLIALNSGDIAANNTNWAHIESGDERETLLKYVTSASSVTLSTTASTGTIALGNAATKIVDTSISAGSTSTNLPTSKAVNDFVTGQGYSKTDTKVIQTSSTASGNYPILASASTSPTSGSAAQAIYNTGVTFNPNTKVIIAEEFSGKVNANHLYQTTNEYLILDGNFS